MSAFGVVGDVVAWFGADTTWSGPEGIPVRLAEHVVLTATSVLVACVLGLPLALWLGHIGRGGLLAINLSGVGRAVPVFVVLVVLSLVLGADDFGPYGRAGLPTLIALVVFAIPPIVTNAYVGMREVDKDTVEAARGMGMRGRQLFGRVELPLAVPLVSAAIRLATVQVWATATIAALVAGPGLGNIITTGFSGQDEAQVVGGALVVAVLALMLEIGLGRLERRVDPVRRARARAARVEPAAEPA